MTQYLASVTDPTKADAIAAVVVFTVVLVVLWLTYRIATGFARCGNGADEYRYDTPNPDTLRSSQLRIDVDATLVKAATPEDLSK